MVAAPDHTASGADVQARRAICHRDEGDSRARHGHLHERRPHMQKLGRRREVKILRPRREQLGAQGQLGAYPKVLTSTAAGA